MALDRIDRPSILLRGILLPLLLFATLVTPPEASATDLPMWSTIDSGGGASAGGAYALVGTAGQSDAGLMNGGGFSLRGGYVGGGFSASAVDDLDDTPTAPVAVFRFHPVTPNPFNPVTSIAFDLPAPELVKVRVYDLRGELVKGLVEQMLPAGRHEVVWRGEDVTGHAVASGVYLVSFTAGPNQIQRKITLVR